ncbi:MAG: hypothetical protein V2I33_23540, partial [Kangiellaceae bacterium]|nr:hypothetical protein [Kangiellaceae bacterium]
MSDGRNEEAEARARREQYLEELRQQIEENKRLREMEQETENSFEREENPLTIPQEDPNDILRKTKSAQHVDEPPPEIAFQPHPPPT